MLGAAILEHSKNNGAIFLDADGCYKIRVKAHALLTALTPYKVTFDGTDWVTAAIADSAISYLVGVPLGAIASGAYGYVVIGGEVDDMVVPSATHTAGYGLKIHDGVVTEQGASWSAASTYANDFAVGMETQAVAATALKVFMVQHLTGPRLATT